jgi:hypothetical protein
LGLPLGPPEFGELGELLGLLGVPGEVGESLGLLGAPGVPGELGELSEVGPDGELSEVGPDGERSGKSPVGEEGLDGELGSSFVGELGLEGELGSSPVGEEGLDGELGSSFVGERGWKESLVLHLLASLGCSWGCFRFLVLHSGMDRLHCHRCSLGFHSHPFVHCSWGYRQREGMVKKANWAPKVHCWVKSLDYFLGHQKMGSKEWKESHLDCCCQAQSCHHRHQWGSKEWKESHLDCC